MDIDIYIDGRARLNEELGSYGAILCYKQHRKEIYDRVTVKTTANRMELKAIIEAMKALKKPCSCRVITNSAYISKNAPHVKLWRKVNWINVSHKPVANADLWEELFNTAAAGHHKLTFVSSADAAIAKQCAKQTRLSLCNK